MSIDSQTARRCQIPFNAMIRPTPTETPLRKQLDEQDQVHLANVLATRLNLPRFCDTTYRNAVAGQDYNQDRINARGFTLDEMPLDYLDWLSGQQWVYGYLRNALTSYLESPEIARELEEKFPIPDRADTDFDWQPEKAFPGGQIERTAGKKGTSSWRQKDRQHWQPVPTSKPVETKTKDQLPLGPNDGFKSTQEVWTKALDLMEQFDQAREYDDLVEPAAFIFKHRRCFAVMTGKKGLTTLLHTLRQSYRRNKRRIFEDSFMQDNNLWYEEWTDGTTNGHGAPRPTVKARKGRVNLKNVEDESEAYTDY